MLLNVVNSATAATTYSIKKMVLCQAAWHFALTMLILPPVGAWLNAQIPSEPLIACFALFTATAAVFILSGWKPQKREMSSKVAHPSWFMRWERAGTYCWFHCWWGRFFCRAFALYGRAGGISSRGHLRICGHLLGRVEFHRSLGDSGKTQLVHLDGLRDCRFYRN